MTKLMLWGDAPGPIWRGLAIELGAALAYYRAKYGIPALVLVSARELGEGEVPTIEGVRIEARWHVPARQMFVGS